MGFTVGATASYVAPRPGSTGPCSRDRRGRCPTTRAAAVGVDVDPTIDGPAGRAATPDADAIATGVAPRTLRLSTKEELKISLRCSFPSSHPTIFRYLNRSRSGCRSRRRSSGSRRHSYRSYRKRHQRSLRRYRCTYRRSSRNDLTRPNSRWWPSGYRPAPHSCLSRFRWLYWCAATPLKRSSGYRLSAYLRYLRSSFRLIR